MKWLYELHGGVFAHSSCRAAEWQTLTIIRLLVADSNNYYYYSNSHSNSQVVLAAE